jgi:hypothetical protein
MSKNKNNKSIESNKPVDMLVSNVKDAKDVDLDKIAETSVEVDVNDILILLVEQLTAIKSYMKSQDETLAAIMERLKKPSIF